MANLVLEEAQAPCSQPWLLLVDNFGRYEQGRTAQITVKDICEEQASI